MPPERAGAALVTRPPTKQQPPLTTVTTEPDEPRGERRLRIAAQGIALNFLRLGEIATTDSIDAELEKALLAAENAALLEHFPALRVGLQGATNTSANITVDELASAIGVSEATARGYLDRGLIPGARKGDPSKRKSRWLIPADAPDLYRKER
jgi:hypothetical protein